MSGDHKVRFLKSPAGSRLFRLYARFAHGLSFRPVEDAERDALYRFRYRIYVEEGYIRPEDHPDGRFTDRYDPVSVTIVAYRRGEIVGAARATPATELGLPTLEYFNVVLPAPVRYGNLVEMGRFMVEPRLRGRSRMITTGLCIGLRAYVRGNPRLRWLIGSMPDEVRRAFRAFVPFRVLEDRRALERRHVEARRQLPGYWNQDNIQPVIADADDF